MSGPEVSGFLQVLAGQTREKLSEKLVDKVSNNEPGMQQWATEVTDWTLAQKSYLIWNDN